MLPGKPCYNDFLWECNYCSQKVSFKLLLAHLKQPVHMSDPKIEIRSTSLEDIARTHFKQGDIKYCLNIGDTKWICKYCEAEVSASSFLSHLSSRFLHPGINIEITTHDRKVLARLHFDRGSILTRVKRGPSKPNKPKTVHRVADYFWNCNYCKGTFTYYSARYHLKSGVHTDEQELAVPKSKRRLFKSHFEEAGLRYQVRNADRVNVWECNYCGDKVSYVGMKNHLLSDTHANDSNLDVVETMELWKLAEEHFTKNELQAKASSSA